MTERNSKGQFINGHTGFKAWLGKKYSPELKEKLSNSHKGYVMPEAQKEKISKKLLGRPSPMRGKHFTEESKLKGRLSQKKRVLEGKHNTYRNGATKLSLLIRECFKYKIWRSKIFERDNWTCKTCGIKAVYLEVHHIKHFSKILIENKIKTVEEALDCLELWDLENGVTLCHNCHIFVGGHKNV